MSLKTIIVIPARYASTRLPGKPLVDICGKPMIQRVYEQAKKARGIDEVIIATDDERIVHAVETFATSASVMLTDPQLPSGTDRIAAVADRIPADIYVNVQGDEPLIAPASIEAAVELVRRGHYSMSTLMCPITDQRELLETSVVKVLADKNHRALYFSRHPIPYSRGKLPEPGTPLACRRHIGLYAYTRATLLQLRDLAPSAAEQGEMLEQLRALEAGIAIGITEIPFSHLGVDTPEDLGRVRKIVTV